MNNMPQNQMTGAQKRKIKARNQAAQGAKRLKFDTIENMFA